MKMRGLTPEIASTTLDLPRSKVKFGLVIPTKDSRPTGTLISNYCYTREIKVGLSTAGIDNQQLES
jgi:hypothetical protein